MPSYAGKVHVQRPATPAPSHKHTRSDHTHNTESAGITHLGRPIGNQSAMRMMGVKNEPTVQRAGSGLADKKEVKKYVKDLGAIRAGWAGMNVNERIKSLLEATNTRLEKAGVPPVQGIVDPFGKMDDEYAAFNRGTWMVFFNPDRINSDTITDTEFGRIVNVAYHECRHAEQTFRVARYLATKGCSAEQICADITIPQPIAQLAVAKPLKPKPVSEWEEAKSWHYNLSKGTAAQSPADIVNAIKDQAIKEYNNARQLYRTLDYFFKHDPRADASGQIQFDQMMTDEDTKQKLIARLAEYKADYAKKRELAKQAFLQYAKMPLEADAWATGAMVEEAMGLPPTLAEDEIQNLDDDERNMLPVLIAALQNQIKQDKLPLQIFTKK